MSIFEIRPGQGVGQVQFGQTPSETKAAMAEPQLYEEWMGGNLNNSLVYQGLILGFDDCDSRGPLPASRLVEARMMGRADAHLFNRPLDAWTKGDLIAFLRSQGHAPTPGHPADLNVQALGLAISFDDGGKPDYVEVWRLKSRRFR